MKRTLIILVVGMVLGMISCKGDHYINDPYGGKYFMSSKTFVVGNKTYYPYGIWFQNGGGGVTKRTALLLRANSVSGVATNQEVIGNYYYALGENFITFIPMNGKNNNQPFRLNIGADNSLQGDDQIKVRRSDGTLHVINGLNLVAVDKNKL